MADFKHWCGNCQIKVYVQRHYGRALTWVDCPYTCEYATAMRCSLNPTEITVMENEKKCNVRCVGLEPMIFGDS